MSQIKQKKKRLKKKKSKIQSLKQLIPNLSNLEELLNKIKKKEIKPKNNEYQEFLKTTLIGYPENIDISEKFIISEELQTFSNPKLIPLMQNLIERTLFDFFNSSEFCLQFRPENVFCYGYRRMDSSNSNFSELPVLDGIQCEIPNTVHKIFFTQNWLNLLSQIGISGFFFLLRYCWIFHKEKNWCFVQVAGSPVYKLIKYPKNNTLSADFSDLIISSSSFLYLHVFPRPKVLFDDHELSIACKMKQDGAKFLFQQIFSKYEKTKQLIPNLENVFDPHSSIAKILDSLIESHKKLQYWDILNGYSPFTSEMKQIRLKKITDDQKLIEYSNLSTPKEQVSQFIVKIFLSLFNQNLWGNDKNKGAILRGIHTLVQLKHQQSLSLSYFLANFKIQDFLWAKQFSGIQTQKLIGCVFIFWIFQLLSKFLGSFFYCTESVGKKNTIIFFRREIWINIQDTFFEKMENEDHFKEIEISEEEIRKETNSTFRLIPKIKEDSLSNGFRPIVNLSKYGNKKNWNQMLQNGFRVLNYERESNENLFGSSLLGVHHLPLIIKPIIQKFKQLPINQRPKLYFVSVDITKSFDSINQDLLLKILEKTIQHKKYFVREYQSFKYHNNNNLKLLHHQVSPNYQYLNFFKLVEGSLVESEVGTIYVDNHKGKNLKKEEIMSLFKKLITEHKIKIGKKYYVQKKGIPQGSVVSPMLCCLYYSEMKKKYLEEFLDQKVEYSFLVNVIDDFLFVSPDKGKAIKFLKRMNEGFSEFSSFINFRKTRTNFDLEINNEMINSCVSEDGEFSWCGFQINVNNFDFTKKLSEDFISQLNISFENKTLDKFRKRILWSTLNNITSILFDSEINSENAIEKNLFYIFTRTAIQFYYMFESYQKTLYPPFFNFNENKENSIFNSDLIKILESTIRISTSSIIKQNCKMRKIKILFIAYNCCLNVFLWKSGKSQFFIQHFKKLIRKIDQKKEQNLKNISNEISIQFQKYLEKLK